MTEQAARDRAAEEAKDGTPRIVMKSPTPFSDGSFYAVFREGDPRAVDYRGGLRIVAKVPHVR